MNEGILPLLCDPETRDSLELRPDALVNPKSGRRFPFRQGIPVFFESVSGANKKYQQLYDRIAWLYDAGEKIYRWLRKENFRDGFLGELEVREAVRVLEVSVGTGANLPYLPSDIEFFGLDVSWGMLARCRKNLARWKRVAELFQGEAERLPFRDDLFDVVFHVGGINFFTDKARAIEEMIRVAKPGTKLVIVDETEKVVKHLYEKMPLTAKYYRKRDVEVACPIELVPRAMRDVRAKEISNGKLYCLSFRKP